MKYKIIFLISIFITILLISISLITANNRKNDIVFSSNSVSVYDWNPINKVSLEATKSKLRIAKSSNISKVYLDLSKFVDIYDDKILQKNKLQEYESDIENYIAYANKINIKVAAVAGSKDWSSNEKRYLNKLVLEGVNNYNENHPNTEINEIQFDIEPYNDNEYSTSVRQLWQDYYLTVAEILKTNENKLIVGFAIPFWIDCDSKFGKDIGGIKNGGCYWNDLISLFESYESRSYLLIMAYRNRLAGENSVSDIIKSEIETGKQKSINILIAQEITDVQPPNTTYYHKSNKYLVDNINKISNIKGVDGIILNDLNAFIARNNNL